MTKVSALVLTAAALAAVAGVPSEARAQTAVSTEAGARAVVDRYCVTCHSNRLKTGGLSLEGINLADVQPGAERLEKVVRKLRAGTMPPLAAPRPDPVSYTSLRTWLESQLDDAATRHPNPGRTESLHRLNRTEYQNAIRDLLGLEGVDFTTLLPGDDASYGFDNIAGVLGMSPTHLDKYLGAARMVSRYAIGDVSIAPTGETHMIRPDLSQDDQMEELPFGTRGGTSLQWYFPVDAEYLLRFQAFTGIGMSEEEPNIIEVSIDGDPIFAEKMAQKSIRKTNNGQDVSARTDWEIRVPVKAGRRTVAFTFVQTTSGQLEDLLEPFLRPPGISSFRLTRVGGNSGPAIGQVSFTGPFNTVSPGDTPSRRLIFSCTPSGGAGEEPCARQILSRLGRRAYRRPLSANDVEALMRFYRQGRSAGGFETGVQVALERLLASPDFLFRIERDPAAARAGQPYPIGDLELASRLSFFIWSSLPDDELLQAASRGVLHEPKELERQTRRMLNDPKSDALIRNFVGQWLRLRALPGVDRNAQMFPDFDDNLRQAMRRETELFFANIVREDRSVIDFLDGDYTFVNERLARHYGIPNVYGSEFRRVSLTDPNRRGLLGQASVLTVTSQANRTSPVTRGKFILENLLGAPPPAPPANVPPLEQTEARGTLRQRMEQHRKNPVCASCHTMMDPLGFALENFDALGQWRSKDEGHALDAAGAMPDGSKFDGVAGLRAALLAKKDVFVATMTEKLMVYAIGRGVEYYDAPAIRQIARAAAQHDYRFSRVIMGVVTSAPFRMRTPAGSAPAPVSQSARQ